MRKSNGDPTQRRVTLQRQITQSHTPELLSFSPSPVPPPLGVLPFIGRIDLEMTDRPLLNEDAGGCRVLSLALLNRHFPHTHTHVHNCTSAKIHDFA